MIASFRFLRRPLRRSNLTLLLTIAMIYPLSLSAGPAQIDTSFESGSGFQGGNVFHINYIESTGTNGSRVLVGGTFNTYAGDPMVRIAFLDENGIPLDDVTPATPAGTFSPRVEASRAVSIDGEEKFLIAGWFSSVGGNPINSIARLNADGSFDDAFDPGDGADNRVMDLVIDGDGRIILVGAFTNFDDQPVNHIVRISENGDLDFVYGDEENGLGFNNNVHAIAIDTSGRILAGGEFTEYQNEGANHLVRMNPDGTIDTSFDTGTGFDGTVESLLIAETGEIFAAGDFSVFDGETASGIVKLNEDGTRDTGFATGEGFNGPVLSIQVDTDGRILAGGNFTEFDGQDLNRIARLLADGARDTSFNPQEGPNQVVNAVAIQSDGGILIGGNFTSYRTEDHNRIARLIGGDGPVIGEGYEDWASGHFDEGEEHLSGPAQDPDGDGIVNLLEYAFNGNPRSNSTSILPTIDTVVDEGDRHLRISFHRIDADDIVYRVQASNDANTWSDTWSSTDHAFPGNPGETVVEEVIDQDHLISPNNSRFLRVVVAFQ